jgi:tRNA(adenine34) deaminase
VIALPPYDPAQAADWMRLALEEAERARDADEVPVGCIVIDPAGNVSGRGGDTRQGAADPWGHAEVHAIRAAAAAQGDWRLDGHTLVVTLEPCPMCAGLILMARVGRVIYGAPNHKWGAAGARADWLRESPFPHRPEVYGGVLAEPCARILSYYFAARRAPLT